ncbi:hypothetical protein ABFX02_14G092600 [Erythranthe guttata]
MANVRSGVPIENEATLQTIQDTLNGIADRLDRIEARSNVSIARFTNWQSISSTVGLHWKTVQFVSIVKHTFGHPFLPQPNVDGVQLAADYPLGSQPPAGLMPANNDEIDRWSSHMTLEQLREKYRGIFWFYNDARFELPVNASLDLILDANITLANFYRHE